MEFEDNTESLQHYADEVRKRLELEREKAEEDHFLRSSLRGSSKLRAIEQYRRIIKEPGFDKHPEVNPAYEDDSFIFPNKSELLELINYLRTKVNSVSESKSQTEIKKEVDISAEIDDSDQWEWLLRVLCDPTLSEAFLMHDKVAMAYERCRAALHPLPRYRWPVLAGLAHDTLEAVRVQLLYSAKQLDGLDKFTLNNMTALYNYLSSSLMQNLFLAMDGLANTWLVDADEETLSELNQHDQAYEDNRLSCNFVEQSAVPGCYATLAYDDQGRDSYSEQGIRLKYVILQKGDNEFLGVTVRCEQRSVLIARIVNGGLAHKTGLLHEGDELLSANGIELIGKDLNSVCDIMASLHGRIVLLIAPSQDPYGQAPSGGIIHLRALFTYEPDQDRYLACQQLGLPFNKGDIIHVTGRRDPNWWQAYRSDEDYGLSGAIGTLAGLIPSPIYQRHRAILRLQYFITSGIDDVELEYSSDSDAAPVPTNNYDKQSSTGKEKRFLGIKLPTFLNSSSKSVVNLDREMSKGSKTDLNSVEGEGEESMSPEDRSRCVLNSSLLNSVYGGRMSGMVKPPDQPTSGVFDEWSAAGPVWGEHGYDLRSLRARRKRGKHQSKKKTGSPCIEGIRTLRKTKSHKDYYPSLVPMPNPELQSGEDPVAWLDKEIARGVIQHPSLWTYEPVTQYIPQPLRRRPLVFVGPAHVGRHQIMQRLISTDPDRFHAPAIHTTDANVKSDSNVSYIPISKEEFDADRNGGEFIEWGLFNRVYYGTSKSTVRKLVETGKVCCMSLRPDSLRIMRSTGLMPYVIFISPPDRVDDLRKLQQRLNLTTNCSDGELKACIETSRKMEIRYGQWFDKVIVPETFEITVEELTQTANHLERKPTWIPRYWLMPPS